MRRPAPIVLSRVAAIVGTGYLAGAVAHRLLPHSKFFEPFAPLYWSIPGALAGAALYAAWTGLRGRPQDTLGMALSGTVGVVLTGLAVRRLPDMTRALFPGSADHALFLATAFYETLCDVSAIVFLFALFLAAFVPSARLSPPPDQGPRAGP